jgi:hypothetical protein
MKKPSRPKAGEIRSPDYLSIVWKHLTESVCEEVFQAHRKSERQRKWTLHALIWFWIGLLQVRYTSQTRALLEGRKGHPLFPAVDASPEAFFQKIQAVRPVFFESLFYAFNHATEEAWPDNFQADFAELGFSGIYAVDGSRLEQVGKLLKVTRKTTKAIIPGSMEALYDLRRGHLKALWFDPDGFASELSMFERVIAEVPSGALLLADRYYPKPVIWRELEAREISMVSRYNKTVKKKKVKVLKELRGAKLCVDDWLVEMGGSAYGTQPVLLRWVHVWSSEFDLVLITNVLDPKRLTPQQLLSLYRERWSVERMYLAMKDVLELNHLYNCSPAAVGQQVYATAILYNALRLAQAKVAAKAKIAPETISVEKLFPVVIENFIKLTFMEVGAENMFVWLQSANPGIERPQFEMTHASLDLQLRHFLVEKRSNKRKQRRYCVGRRKATSFSKIPGAKKYVKLT